MIGKAHWIDCDGGCGTEIIRQGAEVTLGTVLKAAQDEGWSIAEDADLCPACRETRLAREDVPRRRPRNGETGRRHHRGAQQRPARKPPAGGPQSTDERCFHGSTQYEEAT